MSSYSYLISSFTNGINIPQLQEEILAQLSTILYINSNDANIEIFFSSTLSGSEQIILTNICSAHIPSIPSSSMVNSEDPNFAISSNISNVLNFPTSSESQDSGYMVQRYQIENDEGTGSVVADTPAQTGTAQTGSTLTTIKLASGSNSVTDYYKNWWIKITGGTGINQVRKIISYNGITKVATVSTWTITPNATSVYALYFRYTTGLIYDDTNLIWKLVYHPGPPVLPISPSKKLLLNDYAKLTVSDLVINSQSTLTHLNSSNIHVDHSTVSISTATGLTGGGNITSSRTLALDINALVADTNPILNDNLLIYDSVALDHKKINISNLNKIIFPSEFEQSTSEGISSTTLTTNQTKLTYTTNIKPIGTYKWTWTCDITSQTTSGRAIALTTIDGIEVDETEFGGRTAASSTAFLAASTYCSAKFSGFIIQSYATASTHTIAILYRTSVNTSYCGVRRARITVERVA